MARAGEPVHPVAAASRTDARLAGGSASGAIGKPLLRSRFMDRQRVRQERRIAPDIDAEPEAGQATDQQAEGEST